MNPVLHRTAQPISVLEFADALRAAAPPRFPHGRSVFRRRAAMAISGGVDSMALAFLCAEARKANPSLLVADAPVHGFTGLIVDHGLRAESAAEATQVAKALTQMGHRAQVMTLRWPADNKKEGVVVPSAVETAARRQRFWRLAQRMVQLGMVSLLLAHHEDDQYETVLMRLLSGYGLNGGIRGLRGMRGAADLPECQGLYGAHQSGFLDDQRRAMPYVVLNPSRQQRLIMRSAFRGEVLAGHTDDAGSTSTAAQPWTYLHQLLGHSAPPLAPLDTEDMGIMAYRPLLHFGKDRLVATCEANNVPWFEDATNADPTLTLRNALRHVARHHTLPRALQKPAILRLAAHCDAQARQHEAEAQRLLLRHGVVVRFTPNVGTVVARLPRLRARARRRPWRRSLAATDAYATASQERRRLYLRTIAALVVQKLLAFVTPESHVSPVSQLQTVVDTLFPDLADPAGETNGAKTPPADPKSFMICGVHFMPFVDKAQDATAHPTTPLTRSWYLARAPYASAAASSPALPSIALPSLTLARRWDLQPLHWPWTEWSHWNFYDGRFWIRIRTRLPVQVFLEPFDKASSKPFREALAAGGGGRRSPRLAAFLATLKTYAPGKVRYTLPALYAKADVSWALDPGRTGEYWPVGNSQHAREARDHQRQLSMAGDYVGEGMIPEAFDVDYYAAHPPVYHTTGDRRSDLYYWERHLRRHERAKYLQQAQQAQQAKPAKKTNGQSTSGSQWHGTLGTLLALPSIGAHVPGVEQWLQWEVRYRKVDRALLESSHQAALDQMYGRLRQGRA